MNHGSQKMMNELTTELFAFLDDSVLSMQQMLGKLNELREAVIRRDQKTLEQMNDQMPDMAALRDGMQRRQRQICQSFAGVLNCPAQKVNLSYLVSVLESSKAAQLKSMQYLLGDLVGRLSREHRATQLLLRECERLNRMILDSMIGRANQSCTYGSGGRVVRDMHGAILSMRM